VTFSARISEIILCAGAIGSPGILQRSGIGPRAIAGSLGITVQHELPGVGGNLQDHLQLRLIFKLENARTLNQMANSLWGKDGHGPALPAYDRSGPLAMAPSQLGAFVKSDPEQPSANLQYHVQPLSLERFGEPLHTFPAFTASVCNLRPKSRGRIDIRSANPDDAPLIDPNYLSHPDDLSVAADAIRLTRRIVASPALQGPSAPRNTCPARPANREQLHEAAARIGTTIFHPVGTCRMGHDKDAVVDAQLRVHGVAGLAGRRCVDHAEHRVGQYLFAYPDDWRKSRATDSVPSNKEPHTRKRTDNTGMTVGSSTGRLTGQDRGSVAVIRRRQWTTTIITVALQGRGH
jgi:choline dehydrogenase